MGIKIYFSWLIKMINRFLNKSIIYLANIFSSSITFFSPVYSTNLSFQTLFMAFACVFAYVCTKYLYMCVFVYFYINLIMGQKHSGVLLFILFILFLFTFTTPSRPPWSSVEKALPEKIIR